MKKKLKRLIIFAFLFSNMQMFGQVPGHQLYHPIGWDEVWDCMPVPLFWLFYDPPEPPISKYLSILTYNIHGFDGLVYAPLHASVIKGSDIYVASIQEIWTRDLFWDLKAQTQMYGRMVTTRAGVYGIGIMWRNTKTGKPTIKKVKIDTDESDDTKRAYIIAEFNNYCVIATHYSTNWEDRVVMTNSILNNSKIIMCMYKGKPVYIAGDLNEKKEFHDVSTRSIKPLKNAGFKILNEDEKPTEGMIDLILERNTNRYHETVDRGIPDSYIPGISDHKPYRVKVIYEKVYGNL